MKPVIKIFSLFSLLSIIFSTIDAKEYQVAFYSDFEPISYSVDRDQTHAHFHDAQGYEIDLVKAMK